MEKRELTCIGCPMGCALQAEIVDNKVVSVKGNSCPRGKTYAESECISPKRILTSTVQVMGGTIEAVSVKTESPIPKEKIFECINILKGIIVKAPIKEGDIIVNNIGDLGINIIATKNIQRI